MQLKRLLGMVSLMVGLFGQSEAVRAVTISVVSQSRSVSVTAQAGENRETRSSDFSEGGSFQREFGVVVTQELGSDMLSTARANAEQESAINGSTASASGTAFTSAFSGSAVATALSSFEIVFEIVDPLEFALSGELSGEPDVLAILRLGDDVGNELVSLRVGELGQTDVPVNETGALAPATYTLRVLLSACSTEDARFCSGSSLGTGRGSFSIGFSVIPEPATVLLVALGAAFMAIRKAGRA